MKIFLTGGSGFVGRNIFDHFSAKGVSIFAPNEHELDLTSSKNVDDYLRRLKPDVIIHSATTLRDKTDYPEAVAELNLRMFFNIVRSMPDGAKLINLGSGSEYARAHWRDGMSEEYFDQYVPEDSHGFSKYLVSKYIESAHQFRTVTLRIFGIYGRFEDYRFKFISNAIAKNILGLPIIINQNVVYHYIDVLDFCRILEWFVSNEPKYKSYNVMPDHPIDLATLARLVNKAGGDKSEIVVLNDGIGTYYTGDNARLREEMPGFVFSNPEASIRRLYEHLYSARETLDLAALQADEYLSYAKKLRSDYFQKQ